MFDLTRMVEEIAHIAMKMDRHTQIRTPTVVVAGTDDVTYTRKGDTAGP